MVGDGNTGGAITEGDDGARLKAEATVLRAVTARSTTFIAADARSARGVERVGSTGTCSMQISKAGR